MKYYDVIVVGAGHAGCEAALAAARMGPSSLLITGNKKTAAMMSCNPSIGGIGKSHLVSEVDALGGEIARNADYTGIQFRMLNLSKGPAVQSVRIQCDKKEYSKRMVDVLGNCHNLSTLEASVIGISVSNGNLKGVIIGDNSVINAKTVVLAPGTFLNGTIHIGSRSVKGGRSNESVLPGLSANLMKLGFSINRFKTGTPPRIHKDTVNYADMIIQPGLEPPCLISNAAKIDYKSSEAPRKPRGIFAEPCEATDAIHPCGKSQGFLAKKGKNDKLYGENSDFVKLFHVEHTTSNMRPWPPGSSQLPCYLTHTTDITHQIIRDNLKESSLYGGYISSTGVRYCPSVEDKIVKFPDSNKHHVFVEPEGRDSIEIYPNGISNSLPEKIQDEMVHSIPGLKNCKITQYGYAIEYDYSDPRQLTETLESKHIKNLFFAGQINGTTGYEEAAAQGVIAGINSACNALGRNAIIISRNEGYIGVLIDDLITKGVDEPYRMFTSRAEHRLLLRQDNAGLRMLKHAREIGICSESELDAREKSLDMVNAEIRRLGSVFHNSTSLSQLLKNPDMSYDRLPGHNPRLPDEVKNHVEIQLKYEGYIRREQEQIRRQSHIENVQIPDWIDYTVIKTLRFESSQKLQKIRPTTLGQASRIPGVNPADIAILDILIRRGPPKKPVS
ncbi:MAG: FAD-dependent oxidoreductase [Kiritimatiellia bacterium]